MAAESTYEHTINHVVVGLIPLKSHPQCFWKKEKNEIVKVVYGGR